MVSMLALSVVYREFEHMQHKGEEHILVDSESG